MLFRKALFFFLAANASAFVIRPTTLSRSATAFLPIASSLSNPDTDTNQEAAEEKTPSTGDVIEASEVGVSTDSEETDKSEAAAPSEDNSSSSLKAGQTKRNTIYVGNLPFTTSVKDIRELFSEYAEVRYVNLPRNRETGDIKGFAFVDVGSDEEIPKVVDALNGKQMGERPMRVSRSLEKDQIRSTKNTIEGAKKLYVGNLPFVSTKEEIEEFFSAYGEVKDVFVPVNKYGESRGFGFISIKEEDVEGLIEATNGLEFMGRMITVNHPMPPGSKKGKREKPGRTKLFVGNLSFYTSGDTLGEVFEEFGDVYDCYIPQDSESNNSRGFGFVSMLTDDATAAIDALDGCELDGRIISVNEARPRGDKSPPNRDQGADEEDELEI